MKIFKLQFLIIIALSFSFSGIAQPYPAPLIKKGKPTDKHYGISPNLIYETILETSKGQKELINSVVSILDEIGLVKKDTINLSNSQKEFTLKVSIKGGLYYGTGNGEYYKRK